MHFQNPQNGYTEEVPSLAWLWCLIFGSLYFAYKGIWTHAVVSFFLGIATVGISHFIYPFFVRSIIEKHYWKKGWKPVEATGWQAVEQKAS